MPTSLIANLLMNGVETSNSDKQQIDTSPATDEQIKAGQDTKQKTIEEDVNPKTPSSSDSRKQRLSVSITAANQNCATVSIRSLISSAVS